MGLATIVCEKAQDGVGQKALQRLLKSNSAKLASTVVDGEWKQGIYPLGGEAEIAGGLIWLQLGSPWAASRWRAAHAIRSLARFGKWGVLDAIVGKFDSNDASPFQAPELRFYFLHARLWLLIALARLAKEYPQNISRYAEMLRAIAMGKDFPHVLFRHFAGRALLSCAEQGTLTLSGSEMTALKAINQSPFPQKKTEAYTRDSFYQPRRRSIPEPNPRFNFDYDFEKMDISAVSGIFGRFNWETKDAVAAWVRKYDSKVTSMYEDGGRSRHSRYEARDMNERYHLYGQQLGWHALFLVAGDFLAKHSTFQSPYESYDSWEEWLNRALLTRSDGLWLADGVDRRPLNAEVNLYEKGDTGVVLTSDKKKLLALLGIESSIGDNLVVAGDWHSPDNIGIHIGSAFVPSTQAKKLAHALAQEEPFRVWLPRLEEYEDGDEDSRFKKDLYTPWIVCPSVEVGLDGTDPLGAKSAIRRLRFTKEINTLAALRTADPFKRTWIDSEGNVAARSEAWGRSSNYDEENRVDGKRLVCNRRFLRRLLSNMANLELLLLVVLRRYEQGSGGRGSQYWHTTGVIRVKQSLACEFYPGAMNNRLEMKH